ncbi:hypothetical protein RKD32_004559 [Streptomyces sp. SAI-195]
MAATMNRAPKPVVMRNQRGQGDAERESADHRAHQEAGGDDGEVDDEDVLEADAVRQLHGEVGGQQDRDGRGAQPGGEDGREDAQDAAGGVGERHRDLSGGDRAVPFDGVGAVGLGVPGVVDQVDGGGAGGEQHEDQGELPQRVRGEQLARGGRGGDDQDVLDPLAGARGAQQSGRDASRPARRGGLGRLFGGALAQDGRVSHGCLRASSRCRAGP